jgi:hypothetical protein
MITTYIISTGKVMQEKRPNKVLGYRQNDGEPVQTLIGPDMEDRCIIFTISSGDFCIASPQNIDKENDPFIPCDDQVNKKIFGIMKKTPKVYAKYSNILNTRIPR